MRGNRGQGTMCPESEDPSLGSYVPLGKLLCSWLNEATALPGLDYRMTTADM